MNEIKESDLRVFELGTRLTVENAHELLKTVQSFSTALPPRIIVNMQQTRKVDISGLRALVSGMRLVRQMNGRFIISNLSPDIRRMFNSMNLYQVFEVFDTVQAASDQLSVGGTPDITTSRVFPQ